MALPLSPAKRLTFGEAGLMVGFVALALFALWIMAKAYTPAYAFHMALFCAASVLAAFAIFKRYAARDAMPPPQTISGRPNYNFGPVKFCTIAAIIWAIAGFSVGLYLALELAFPAFNLDLPWINFRRLRPLHTSAVIFAFGGNVLLATSFYVVQRTCRARLAGTLAPWFVARCSRATHMACSIGILAPPSPMTSRN
jgi:cytochrome c oxidase cbb3-type subunit I